ncbi:hypothetical protein Ga0466249_001696 [Sporomusaceae bacterium BoRhaA]|uniref:hypothetical protein n=1 Tax=Pelorhabdus rhamnosifermentans TaxID=2772457 RepID=UPI001C0636E7|nr:hypothetical protein [Pelorhabdus rhamnosifermentans]MBU2700604.1 hypothetical protein [Pelorhabdus rhamnosifermentans]
MFLERSELHDLTMLVLNKTQFEWENTESTKLAEEVAKKYKQVRETIQRNFDDQNLN